MCAAFVFVFAVALALIIIKINIVGDVVVCAVCCGRIRIKDQGSESGSRIGIRIKIVDDKVLCGVCCGSRLHQTLPSVIAPCTRLTEECIFIYDFVYLCMYLYQ